MKHILGIFILLSITLSVMGQGSGNPFDLKYRPSKPSPNTPVPPLEVKTDTPLVQPIPKKPVSTNTGDLISPPDTLQPLSSGITLDTTPSGSQDNPFEMKSDPDSGATSMAFPKDTGIGKSETKDVLQPPIYKKTGKGFQIFFVLLSLLFLIFIVNVERSFVRDLWRVISNENYSSLHHRNQRNTMRQILLLMGYTVFILQGGLFLYHALQIFNYKGTHLDNIWTSIALVLGIYLIRHGIIRYLRWLFNNDKEMTLFGFDISIFNTMVGLVLLPINILLIFGPENIYNGLIIIGIVTIIIAYMLRQLRWILSARQLISHSLFLFFVYLCAVEILPLWAVSKLFW